MPRPTQPRGGLLFALLCLTGCGVYDYHLGGRTAEAGASGGPSGGAGGARANSAGGTAGKSSAAGSSTGGTTASSSTVQPALPGLVGWASVSDCGPRGTTGGKDGPVVRPQTPAELDDAVRAIGPSVIEISGKMDLGTVVPQVTGDKTLVGINGAELLGSLRVRDARNVVVKNIRFNGGGIPGNLDAVEVDNSTCVWFDHCDFFDGPDSNLDIVRGADLITVSWSKFYYVVKTNDHRLGSVCGNSDTDWPGRINVTFHHNWWSSGVALNMPSVRHGKVHIFNSYFSAAGNTNCIGAGYMAKLLVQNNVFEGVKNPIVFNSDSDTAEVVESGNDYTTATGEHVSRGTAFEPPYPYELQSTGEVAQAVTAAAGIQP